ncbi:MAG: riboflavin synthase [Capsulimonadaceae bacterium]|nr:riboflavin synthase [Capsulimonadaceae bacterium]
MFTGIIEAVGTVQTIERAEEHARLTVSAPGDVFVGIKIGDSIAVNGTCLTAVEISAAGVSFDAMYETMRKTALGHLAAGDPVNLERSMAADGRFSGHIVQGHVDATGSIASIRQIDNSYVIYIDVPRDLMRYIVRKGSIAIDGISLTVVDAEDRTFSVAIIPHTWAETNLSSKHAGDPVNIETDIIGKYVEKLVGNTTYAAAPLGIELNPRPSQSVSNPTTELL